MIPKIDLVAIYLVLPNDYW